MADVLSVIVDGTTILIEAEPSYGLQDTSPMSKSLDEARDAFERARTTVTSVAKSMVEAVRELDRKVTPDEFTLEFAIKFTAEGNALVAKAAAEANLKITMKYVHVKAEPQ